MNKEMFKKLLEDNVPDIDLTNLDKMFEGVDGAIGGAIKSTKETTLDKMKKEALESAKDEVIKSLKIDGIDSETKLQAHIAGLSSNEDAQNLITMTKERDTFKSTAEKFEKDYNKANGKLTSYSRESKLTSKGLTAKEAKYHSFQINEMVTDALDYDKAEEQYIKDNAEVFVEQPTKTKVTGTPRYNRSSNTSGLNDYDRKMADLGYGDK